ncbi:MAG: site-2 protease family protein [Leptolyngbya sp. SIO3F4]|nr:site-2 protease family protein [Leptolyngbya sp. SIO3F4]
MLNGWWVADVLNSQNGTVYLVSWIVVVVGSIVLHELAHGWAAIYKGDRTPIELGHMTWNPLVHMGQMSLILFLVFGIAFGAMPVNPSRMRGRYADAFVAVAGPAMNVLIALVCIVLAGVVLGLGNKIGDPLASNLFLFFTTGSWLNIVLCVFNLLPVPPLDGSRILGNLYPAYNRLWMSENGQWMALGAFILVFIFAGDFIIPIAMSITSLGVSSVASIF